MASEKIYPPNPKYGLSHSKVEYQISDDASKSVAENRLNPNHPLLSKINNMARVQSIKYPKVWPCSPTI